MTPVPRPAYGVGVPLAGKWHEALNSDSSIYGGANLGNAGLAETRPVALNGEAQSLMLVLPPLATLIFRHEA